MRHALSPPTPTAMTSQSAKVALSLQIALLLMGTLMPGPWRAGLEASLHAPFGMASWAHAVLFAGLAIAARVMRWRVGQVLLAALVLALLTEGLQFFAIDRHPRWIDVGIDMAGAGYGLAVVSGWRWFCTGFGSRVSNGDKG